MINKLYKNGLKESKLEYKNLNSKLNNSLNSKFDFENVFEIVDFSSKDADIEDLVTQYIVGFFLNNKEIDINKISIFLLI